jgi:tetratricopeptide (TPR) repeat protein
VAEAALPLGLQLQGGQAALSLERPVWVSFGRVDRLVMRWPDVRYPFDLGRGMRELKRLRGRLGEFDLLVVPGRLGGCLDERALARFGILGLEVQVAAGRVRLAFQAEIGGRSAEVTVPLALQPAPGGVLRVALDVPRVYGPLPLPAPLLLAGLAAAATGRDGNWTTADPPLVRCPALASWELDVRELTLLGLLTPRGWRLPDRARIELLAVEVDQEGVHLRLGEGECPPPPAPAPGAAAALRLIADGDASLAAGESRPALEAYRQAAVLDDPDGAFDRILALLAVGGDPAALEAEVRARAEAAPGAVWVALGRAAAAAERGRQAEAAGVYQALAEALAGQGEPYDRACALAAAADALDRAGQGEAAQSQRSAALAALEAVGAGGAGLRARLSTPRRRADAEVEATPAIRLSSRGSQLARARIAWQEGRLEEGARLYEGLLGAPAGDAAAAESHLRLAQWARLQGQMATASRHLTRALRGEPDAGAPAEVLLEVLETFGRTEDLVRILRERLERTEHELARRELVRALGAVLERAGRAEEAVALYRQALERGDEDILSLARLAEIFRREGRPAELRGVLQPLFSQLVEGQGGRVIEEVEAGVDLETVAVELAALQEPDPGGRERARQILERALALRPGASEARAALAVLGPSGTEG